MRSTRSAPETLGLRGLLNMQVEMSGVIFCSVVLNHRRCICRENSERAASRSGQQCLVGGGGSAGSADLHKIGRLSTAA